MLVAEYDYKTDIMVQRNEAWEDGLSTGIAEGIAEGILTLLSEMGTIPQALRERINSESNIATLNKWLILASKCNSIERFRNMLDK